MSGETLHTTGSAAAELEELRTEIAEVDSAILGLISRRTGLARQIGRVKTELGIPVLDPAREAAVVRAAAIRARAHDLSEDEVRHIFWQLIGLCRRAQQAGSTAP